MISAAEARKKTVEKNRDLIDRQMTMIEVKINEAVSKGQSSCCIDHPLHKEVIRQLTDMGYLVISGGRYNDIEYSIKW